MITEAKARRMMNRIALGGDLADAKQRGLVTNAEEERLFLALEKEVTEIHDGGGILADGGFTDWTEDND